MIGSLLILVCVCAIFIYIYYTKLMKKRVDRIKNRVIADFLSAHNLDNINHIKVNKFQQVEIIYSDMIVRLDSGQFMFVNDPREEVVGFKKYEEDRKAKKNEIEKRVYKNIVVLMTKTRYKNLTIN
ncbi:hypothetical protein [Staphylococcus aureus]|uniref:hypothetical protein n=2 Tax=Staphylococcus aureus TaxID=1280 RepID=UPI00025F511B|nr:hypothetical protein [Staphylococcus aureus]EZR31385.1 hypothetical protein V138_02599 [Staphylococcus aureus ZTA11/03130-3ST]EIK13971.1 hypothetical protein MQK_02538 [Staphylococcus aureus subsp. aureus VRS6]MBS3622420.1 hypothetical protein [Staphylococcus aureus]WAA05892.1 hypothetical protein M1F51_13880 [Staphylococcus aureus]HAR4980414.1 hypothetical protein [Staphylococcus aureus]